jgi:O-antigen ligase
VTTRTAVLVLVFFALILTEEAVAYVWMTHQVPYVMAFGVIVVLIVLLGRALLGLSNARVRARYRDNSPRRRFP